MSHAKTDQIDHSVHTARAWLTDIAAAFGSNDQRFALRMLRAWLHTTRDRLTVDANAQFAAQLPEVIRGIYYDGWEPSKVPMKYRAQGYIERFAREAGIPERDVRWTAARISLILQAHFSPGQLEHALIQLPAELREIVAGVDRPAGAGAPYGRAVAAAAR